MTSYHFRTIIFCSSLKLLFGSTSLRAMAVFRSQGLLPFCGYPSHFLHARKSRHATTSTWSAIGAPFLCYGRQGTRGGVVDERGTCDEESRTFSVVGDGNFYPRHFGGRLEFPSLALHHGALDLVSRSGGESYLCGGGGFRRPLLRPCYVLSMARALLFFAATAHEECGAREPVKRILRDTQPISIYQEVPL